MQNSMELKSFPSNPNHSHQLITRTEPLMLINYIIGSQWKHYLSHLTITIVTSKASRSHQPLNYSFQQLAKIKQAQKNYRQWDMASYYCINIFNHLPAKWASCSLSKLIFFHLIVVELSNELPFRYRLNCLAADYSFLF